MIQGSGMHQGLQAKPQRAGSVIDYSGVSRSVGMDPKSLGRQEFLLRPGCFQVIDGDTIKVFANPKPKKTASSPRNYNQAFSMRFRSTNAPERPRGRATDEIMRSIGLDPYRNSPGQWATEALSGYLDRRALLVQPTGRTDNYGRMLCDMSVVPYTDGSPDLNRAISLERIMLEKKIVNPFEQERPPPLHPQEFGLGGP